MAEEHPPSPALKGVPFAWEIAGQARYDGQRVSVSSWFNNKSIAKIVLFAILFPFGMKNFPILAINNSGKCSDML